MCKAKKKREKLPKDEKSTRETARPERFEKNR
jgi:hypothetical protein